jgi:hypothetical protein
VDLAQVLRLSPLVIFSAGLGDLAFPRLGRQLSHRVQEQLASLFTRWGHHGCSWNSTYSYVRISVSLCPEKKTLLANFRSLFPRWKKRMETLDVEGLCEKNQSRATHSKSPYGARPILRVRSAYTLHPRLVRMRPIPNEHCVPIALSDLVPAVTDDDSLSSNWW